MPLEDFIELAKGVGVDAVEIRNDIAGREFADGTPAAELRDKLDDAGLKLASINALQRFNDWTGARERELRTLAAYAATLGAPGIVLCPVIAADHGWSAADLDTKLRHSVRMMRPIFLEYGIKGYLEPLGMRDSTLKHQESIVTAVDEVEAWDAFQLCHDTFQFYRSSDARMFPERIGLVHVSGIARKDLGPVELTEPDRGFVFVGDRVDNVGQLKRLTEAGYRGYVSFEPFDPEVQQDPHILQRLGASIHFLRAALGGGR
ncbi:MAG: TIM barrel protein [Devosia nanyangense]|uniref:TIM barrel protein n=1 Tax=Devosia nanyangense TaxID=1228055 RepID=A0A933NZR0_9HYPH|nr:TIM barrel protein [Devosia nanyangense]